MLYNFARVSYVPAHHRGGCGPRHLPRGHRARGARGEALFQSVDRAGKRLTARPLTRRLVLAMIKRPATAAELPASTCCHTFRATGERRTCRTGGRSSTRQQIAGHASPKTTKLYDRTADRVTVDDHAAPGDRVNRRRHVGAASARGWRYGCPKRGSPFLGRRRAHAFGRMR